MSLSGEGVIYATSPSDKVAQETARRERRRRKIVKELFDTEKTYLTHLELINKFFDFPLRFACLVPDDVHGRLFSNLEQIREVNVTLLETMEQTTIGQAFTQLAPFLKLYSTYANNHQQALNTLHEWQIKSQEFSSFIARQEDRPEVKGLKLNALLITPVQRIPRYKMLLEELLKNTPDEHHDYQKISEAAERMADIAMHINEHIRQNENFMKMLAIQRSFDSSAPKLLAPGRIFIKEGPLKKVSRKGGKSYERMFFLFSDILLYGKPKFLDGGGKQYTCSCVLPLRHCKVETVFITNFGKSDTGGVFRITCKEESLVLYSDDKKNAKEWSEEVDKAIRKVCDDRQTLRKPSSNKIPLRGRSLRRHRQQQKKTDIKIPGKTPMRPLSIISNISEDSDCSPNVRARLEPVRQHFKLARNTSISHFDNKVEETDLDSPVLRKKTCPDNSLAGTDSYRDSFSSKISQDSCRESFEEDSTADSEQQSLKQYSFSLRGSQSNLCEPVKLTSEISYQRSPKKKRESINKTSGKETSHLNQSRFIHTSEALQADSSSSQLENLPQASIAWFPPKSPAHKLQRKTFNMKLRSYFQKPLKRFQKTKRGMSSETCSPFKCLSNGKTD
ncbi:rho guanine nucleotide exchange factor 39-like [Physella acuta]|uniref:rho guanine nucleotide exchange factor 39-like n=1 Tax=Physella acuta TaxID=109671 RepID=UPI0027DE4D40|nr:rho guanine nucleotide exchange factor 39-like [Physella acuta]